MVQPDETYVEDQATIRVNNSHRWSLTSSLRKAINLRITKEEMLRTNEPLMHAMQLVNGDYMVVIAAYHQLHCVVSCFAILRYPGNIFQRKS